MFGPPRAYAPFFASILLAACPTTTPTPEATPPVVNLGADPAVPAGPGEVRAGVIREGEAGEAGLIGGIGGEGRGGDFKLFNHRVQFVVQGVYEGHGYVEGGGSIIDMDLVRPEGQLGRDVTDDLFLAFGVARLFRAESMELINDGTDGAPAVVRAVGTDVSWELVQGTIESPEPLLPDLFLSVVQDYELAPDSWSLKVTATFTNDGDEAIRFAPADGHMGSEEETIPWTSNEGVGVEAGGDVGALGAVGVHGEGVFGLWPAEGTVSPMGAATLLGSAGLTSLTGHGWVDLEPGATTTLVRSFSFAPDTATVEAERRRSQGEDLGTVTGTVTDEGGAGIAGVRVHFTSAEAEPERVLGFVVTGADGSYSAELPPGDWLAWAVATPPNEHVQLPAGAGRYGPFASAMRNQEVLDALTGATSPAPIDWAQGHPTPAAVPITVSADGEATADLTMEDGARLILDVTDDAGQPLASVVEVRWVDDGTGPTDTVPESLRRAIGLNGLSNRAAWAWTGDGHVELPILPGQVDVVVSSGFRHERQTFEAVELSAGANTSLSASLPQVLQRDGWFAMDTHLHGAPSPDGSLSMEERLITCATAGVDVPVTTDHDRLADYRPVATALGLDDTMLAMAGVETSPVMRGHFNLFPVEPQPADVPNRGAVDWWRPSETTDELVERMRTSPGATDQTLVQVNHGRSPGMLSVGAYSPVSGSPGTPHLFSWDFDAMEVVSGNSWLSWEELRADWMSLLNIGEIRIPTGGSDSHDRTKVCGYGRTDVYVGADSVADLDITAVRDAFAAKHVVVGGGVTLRATLDLGEGPTLPGDTTVGSAGDLSVQVSGPSWIQPELLRVYRNGIVVHEQELGESTGAVIFDGQIPVDATEDSWFVAEVEGGEGLGQAWGGARPYALTMAFFVDVEGDGWQPPGL